MANAYEQAAPTKSLGRNGSHQAEDDLMSGGFGQSAPPSIERPMTTSARRVTASNESVDEVSGDAFIALESLGQETTDEVGLTDEVGMDGTESGEQFFEASPVQLAAESGQETALSDLRGIEGFEAPLSGESASVAAEAALQEAGSATGEGAGQEEFLPILAALAPALISSIGPSVAKAVVGKLSPRAQKMIRALPGARTAVQGVLGAAKAAGGRGSILGLVAKLFESAEAKGDGSETGAEVDDTFATEAAAALEVIIGTDDRVRIHATTQIPWRRICALRIQFPNGSTYRGTGFLVGPRAVVTAGHCVYLHSQGGWARRIEVIPASNGPAKPFGQATATSFRSVAGWVKNKKPEYDFGCVVLPAGSFGGKNLGSFGFAAFSPPALLAQSAVVAGYPGDKPFAELWGMARKIKTVTAKTLIYDIDSMGGQSGAPVYITRNGQRYVVGIHNYGAATGNSATRVTPEVMARLTAWRML